MRQLRALLIRLRVSLSWRNGRDAELELADHLSNQIDDNIRAGMSPDDARRDATIKLGGIGPARERYRERAGVPTIDSLARDARHAVRLLGRYPGFSLAAALILAVGIAGVTTVISFTNAVFAYGPPVDLSRRVSIWGLSPDRRDPRAGVAPRDFVAWTARSASVERFVATRRTRVTLIDGARVAQAAASEATPGLFDVLGVTLARGRPFTDQDAVRGAAPTAILGHAFWRQQFDSAPDIVGRTVLIDGVPTGIIGVTTPEFSASAQVIVPLVIEASAASMTQRTLTVSGLLRPAVSIQQAQTELTNIATQLQREYPETNRGWAVNVRPFVESIGNPQARQSLTAMAAVAVLVFLVACANVANLLFARGVGRRREVGVRLALGVSKGRLQRQFLFESLALSTMSAAAAVLLAYGAIRWLRSVLPGLFPPEVVDRLAIDPGVLILATLGSVFVCVAVPAWQASRLDTSAALHERASHVGGLRRQRVRNLSLASQTTVATVLVAVTGLGLLGAANMSALVESGFSARGVTTGELVIPADRYPDQGVADLVRRLLERLGGLPGVEVASAASRVPSSRRSSPRRPLTIEGRVEMVDGAAWALDVTVAPGYFPALRIPMRAGRDFEVRDGSGAPLAVIMSRAAEQRYWPGRSAVGAKIRLGDETDPSAWRTVVGVVADVRNDDLASPPLPHVYVPLAQQPLRTVTLVVRGRDGRPISPAVFMSAVSQVDRDQPVYSVRTMVDMLDADVVSGVRVPMQLFGGFGLVALLLAAGGIYSLLAFSVAQRTPEIALRMALGASRKAVVALVTGHGLRPVVLGMTLGLIAAATLGSFMAAAFPQYRMSPATSGIIYSETAVLLVVVAMLSALHPTIRSTRVQPLAALSSE